MKITWSLILLVVQQQQDTSMKNQSFTLLPVVSSRFFFNALTATLNHVLLIQPHWTSCCFRISSWNRFRSDFQADWDSIIISY